MQVKNKKGYISVEAVFGIVAFLMVLLLIIGLFSYMYPRQALEKQVHILAQEAKVTGGLTAEQISDFQTTLSDMGYTSNINAYTLQGGSQRNVLGVAPRGTAYTSCTNASMYTSFVKRDSGQKIVISVSVKSEDGLVKGILGFFGGNMLPENYTFTETVLSERNRC